MKYIILDDGNETPILFPPWLQHVNVAGENRVISAGTVSIYGDEESKGGLFVSAYGESISLNVKSRPEDSDIIKRAIEFRG